MTLVFCIAAFTQPKFVFNNLNAAGYGKPLTMYQYLYSRNLDSRMIAEPLRWYDCSQETDAGCALLIVSRLRARDLTQKPALIRAVCQSSTRGHKQMAGYYRPDLIALAETKFAAQQICR
jgi:acetyl-CoA acetyltransferase